MGKVLLARQDGVNVLKFVGEVRLVLGPTINQFLAQIGEDPEISQIIIDLSEATCVDSTSLGLMARISIGSKEKLGKLPTMVSPNEDINRVLSSMGFEKLFVLVKSTEIDCGKAGELPTQVVSEEAMREQVLAAHKTLMSLNDKNYACFCDLVDALEQERDRESEGCLNVRRAG